MSSIKNLSDLKKNCTFVDDDINEFNILNKIKELDYKDKLINDEISQFMVYDIDEIYDSYYSYLQDDYNFGDGLQVNNDYLSIHYDSLYDQYQMALSVAISDGCDSEIISILFAVYPHLKSILACNELILYYFQNNNNRDLIDLGFMELKEFKLSWDNAFIALLESRDETRFCDPELRWVIVKFIRSLKNNIIEKPIFQTRVEYIDYLVNAYSFIRAEDFQEDFIRHGKVMFKELQRLMSELKKANGYEDYISGTENKEIYIGDPYFGGGITGLKNVSNTEKLHGQFYDIFSDYSFSDKKISKDSKFVVYAYMMPHYISFVKSLSLYIDVKNIDNDNFEFNLEELVDVMGFDKYVCPNDRIAFVEKIDIDSAKNEFFVERKKYEESCQKLSKLFSSYVLFLHLMADYEDALFGKRKLLDVKFNNFYDEYFEDNCNAERKRYDEVSFMEMLSYGDAGRYLASEIKYDKLWGLSENNYLNEKLNTTSVYKHFILLYEKTRDYGSNHEKKIVVAAKHIDGILSIVEHRLEGYFRIYKILNDYISLDGEFRPDFSEVIDNVLIEDGGVTISNYHVKNVNDLYAVVVDANVYVTPDDIHNLADFITNSIKKHKNKMELNDQEIQSKLSDDSKKEREYIANITNNYINVLARKYKSLCYKDEYDIVKKEKFVEEVVYFSKHKFIDVNNFSLSQISKIILEIVESHVNSENVSACNNVLFEDMTPIEYEEYCKSILIDLGWNAYNTPQSGDQGADIVADKNSVKMVVQCKLYSSPVGNKAVQEVIAAKVYHDADLALVVSNASYTKSARTLANASNVYLLHHDDLKNSSLIGNDYVG